MRVKNLLFLAGAVSANVNPCPLDGPVFPQPADLASMPLIQQAIANLTAQFEAFEADPSSPTANLSYSLQVFSTSTDEPLWERQWTAPNLASLRHDGVTNVTGDTVFRLGSLTKIFTIYNFLLNAGDLIWNQPIINYVPELQVIQQNRSNQNAIQYTDWNAVTIGSLATQMGGVPRDYSLLGELSQESVAPHLIQYGLPPLPASAYPPCGDDPLCTRAQFFQGLAKLYPSLAPMQTPAYSDIGFQLLGYALETITNKTYFGSLYQTVLSPLGLNHTFYTTPSSSLGIIPGNINATGWNFNIGQESPAGNMYSSANDISAFGRAIMSSTQLDPVVTRRWLKPFAFSSDPRASVGAPWGVRRIPLGGEYRETTGYNKAGQIGNYNGAFILIPDYNIGFTILIAGTLPYNINWQIADMIGNVMVPAVDGAAKLEAQAKYTGTYSTGTSLNSSITITTDSGPGLVIESWISNGTDFKTIATALWIEYQAAIPDIRLYPSGLETPVAAGGKRVVMKAIYGDLGATAQTNKMFSTDCGSWVGVESVLYASLSLDEFIFTLNAQGEVTDIGIPALRITMPLDS